MKWARLLKGVLCRSATIESTTRKVWHLRREDGAEYYITVRGPAYGDNEVEIAEYDHEGNFIVGSYVPIDWLLKTKIGETMIPFKKNSAYIEPPWFYECTWSRFESYLKHGWNKEHSTKSD